MKFALVYQCGIADVFAVDEHLLCAKGRNGKLRNARREVQSDFRSCEVFCQGLIRGGAVVLVASCNRAGDISDCTWTSGLDDCPFRDEARPVFTKSEKINWDW